MEKTYEQELEEQHEEIRNLFLEAFDGDNFDWDNLEDKTYIITEFEVEKDVNPEDGWCSVEAVFQIHDRYFEVLYDLMGKDIDEIYNLEKPVEVYPKEVISVIYTTDKQEVK